MSIWLIIALLGVAGEQYFFFMQRSALELCRARNIPPEARFALLPGYYRGGRLPSIGKWIGAGVIGFGGDWPVAGAIIFVSFLLSTFLPVPHTAFFGIFYRELDEPTNQATEEIRQLMREALESVDREFGVTERGSNP